MNGSLPTGFSEVDSGFGSWKFLWKPHPDREPTSETLVGRHPIHPRVKKMHGRRGSDAVWLNISKHRCNYSVCVPVYAQQTPRYLVWRQQRIHDASTVALGFLKGHEKLILSVRSRFTRTACLRWSLDEYPSTRKVIGSSVTLCLVCSWPKPAGHGGVVYAQILDQCAV